jgi:glutathione S-transferase
MSDGKLYIGNRRYSSWSLRGWLMVELAGLDVETIVIPMGPSGTPAIKSTSPNGLVPYLEHRGAKIWESLAVAEYCAEFCPALWPADQAARANARSIAAEMHAGFRALRRAMPMIIGRRIPGHGQNPESLADISRIETLWADTKHQFGAGGPYLFGENFTAADAMFAPVVFRFVSYTPPLSAASLAYCQAVLAHPAIAKWADLAAKEPASWLLDKYEGIA